MEDSHKTGQLVCIYSYMYVRMYWCATYVPSASISNKFASPQDLQLFSRTLIPLLP